VKKPWLGLRYLKALCSYALLLSLLVVTGCGSALSTPEQINAFEKAGPITDPRDPNNTEITNNHNGPYRVVPGDLLEFQMPGVLRIISSNDPQTLEEIEPYSCRVSRDGEITLPIIGQVHVDGKTIAQIESLVISAYYPKYVVNIPMVVCEIKHYKTENERVFTVMGLVNHPDAFTYPPDVRYNLMEALAFAGGFDLNADPRYVKVYRQSEDSEVVCATFGIDKKSMADTYNVMVKPGDVIYVDHTFRTRTNTFLARILRIGVGADVRYTGQ